MKQWEFYRRVDLEWGISKRVKGRYFNIKDLILANPTFETTQIGPNLWFVCDTKVLYRIVEV